MVYKKFFLFITMVSCLGAISASALPFNTDMVNTQIKTGAIMRPKSDGSVAVGSLSYHLESKDDAAKLENPLKGSEVSWKTGARLFRVNCYPCHGDITQKEYKGGPVAAKFVMPPDITSDYYRKEKTDGYIFGVIHFGGMAIMPALGWKLSPTEHWDIINYVRHVQEMKAQGAK